MIITVYTKDGEESFSGMFLSCKVNEKGSLILYNTSGVEFRRVYNSKDWEDYVIGY